MTKRIVSGIFILTALGALGVILAGALTSGEQLIVRFLTAVIVAALGLYVISDLRLQADDDATTGRSTGRARLAAVDAPPNSTAAFMATVTKKGDGRSGQDEDIRVGKADDRIDLPDAGVGTTPSSTTEPVSAVVEGAGSPSAPPVPERTGPAPVTVRAPDLPGLNNRATATVTELFGDRGTSGTGPLEVWPDPVPAEAAQETITEGAGSHPIVGSGPAEEPPADDEEMAAPPRSTPATVPADEDLAKPAAVIDFEYSGELQAPDYQWPAPPDSSAGDQPAATDGTDRGETDRLPIVARGSDDDQTGAIPSRFETPVPTEAGEQQVNGHQAEEATDGVNGRHRSLPAPLSDAGTGAVDYADAPLAPIIDLRDVATAGNNLEVAIRSGEVEVIATLIEQGMLSTNGPITDRDVRTMVYVAFTSNELRKLLLAGGRPDGANEGLDLGPVELFDETLHAPAPKTLYSGLPETEARSQLG